MGNTFMRLCRDLYDSASSKWSVSHEAELSLFTGLLLFALYVRLWKLLAIPQLILNDEGRFSYESWYYLTEASLSKGVVGILGLGWGSISQISFLVHSYANMLLGVPNQYALWYGRATSGAIGVIGISILYAFVRRWWGSGVALVSMAVASTMELHVIWSRRATNDIDMAVLIPLPLLALSWVVDIGSAWSYAALGVAVGAGWYGYLGCKITTFAIPIIVLVNACSLRNKRYLFIALGTFVLTVAPLLPALCNEWRVVYAFHEGRTDVMSPILSALRGDVGVLMTIVWSRYPLVADVPVTNYLVLAGALIAVGQLRDVRYRVLLMWLGLTGYVGIMGVGWLEARLFPVWPALAICPSLVVIPFRRIRHCRAVLAVVVSLVAIEEGATAYFIKIPQHGHGVRWDVCDAVWNGSRSISVVGPEQNLTEHYIACGFNETLRTDRPSGSGRNWPTPTEVEYKEEGPYADTIIFMLPAELRVKPKWDVRAIFWDREIIGYRVSTRG